MPPRTVLTIGNFDGVHLGHRALLTEARRRAAEQSTETRVVAVTFDPPPTAVLRPGSEPPQIDAPERRVAWLKQAGADAVEVMPIEPATLEQTAERFVADIVARFAPVAIVEGPDFRFGKHRAGDHALLQKLGETHGFRAVQRPRAQAVLADRQTVPVSSSLIRWLIGRGRVRDAAVCLGRPFELTAPVVRGEQRGRTLGIPTANLEAGALRGRIVPADGVYAAHAQTVDGRVHPAAVSIGTKPTFQGRRQTTVEAHLLDFAGDLYDRPLTLRFVRWVRDQYAFPGLDPLVAQLRRDLQRIETLLSTDSLSAPVPA
ncbi:MAG: riboflavin biosynthesis protein RibF [Planctomycetota bacterium]